MTIQISDHAFVRYLERAHGHDVTQYKQAIIQPIEHLLSFVGKATATIHWQGMTYIIVKGVLVTIYTQKG